MSKNYTQAPGEYCDAARTRRKRNRRLSLCCGRSRGHRGICIT